ncbi:hypothetical protein AAFC00_000414 [Neodothiora populina]|uniref:TPR domain protein n=1 Tax=Neodothiora populina TaxID=2781224 RepID=A0ABR3PD26_9PEZI
MFRSPAARALRRTIAVPAAETKTRCLNTLTRPSIRSKLAGQSYLKAQGRRTFASQDSVWTRCKQLYHRHPYQVSLAGVIILFASGCIVYANYLYQSYIIASFHKYPEPVAQKLRRALYYTNTDLQPKEALKYYKQALEIANELGMDPFSDEIIGVKIQVAALMERINNFPKAIEVLEILKRDMLNWEELLGGLERNKQKRTRVLKQAIAVSVKLGELYSNPYVQDPKTAEERLVWAVETTLREKARREKANVNSEEEGEWMDDNEIGASLEALAHNYEEQDKHYLATPLFLQALSLKPTQDCHSVTLMNNLSISLAQQNPPASLIAQGEAPPSRKALVANATQWAEKAIQVAAGITPPVRDEECDYACAVALHNLGEFAEMNNNVKEARSKYREAISLAKGLGFQEGLDNSSEALRRVTKAG